MPSSSLTLVKSGFARFLPGLAPGVVPWQAPLPSPGKLRVLLAEDNIANQRLALRMLEKRGHVVLVANDGREAIAILQREQVDVVLMDVQMPIMDGFQATAAIREGEKTAGGHLPIVALTAHALERCLAKWHGRLLVEADPGSGSRPGAGRSVQCSPMTAASESGLCRRLIAWK